MDREFGMDMCMLLYFKRITTRTCILQGTLLTVNVAWMGGESGGDGVHVYV